MGVGQVIFTTRPNQQAVQGFPVNRYYTKAESDARYAPIGGTGVTSFNTRTGAVMPQLGDYTTSIVAEGSNLYFTQARVIASPLTGYTSGAGTVSATDSILQAIQKLNGNIAAIPTAVTSVTGTLNRITSSGGTTPAIDISATFEALLGKVASPLSQFAATTSAQLAGVISDATGTGSLVFGTGPTISLASASTAVTQAVTDSSTKLATTAFVYNALNNFASKQSVAYASTSPLPANTYNNGASGVGATLTGNSNGFLVIDGVTLVLGQTGERVLIAGEATQANNGWYVITRTGSAVTSYILTRTTDSDTGAEIGAGYITSVTAPNTVTPGANNGKVFVSIAADPFTVGTTALTFSAIGTTSALTVGTTAISSGTTGRVLYDNAGTLGEYVVGGTGTLASLQVDNTFAGVNTFSNNYTRFGIAPYLAVTKGADFTNTDNTTAGVQIGVENQSGGTSAYNGFYLNNDLAVSGDVTHFMFLGQNSSTYSDPAFGTLFAVPNLGYLQNTDAPIAYVTSHATNGGHLFYDGGTSTSNQVMSVTKSGILLKKASRGQFVQLTDASTIAVDLSLANNYYVTLGGNRTLGVPTNIVAGQSGVINVYQDITGSRTLAYGWIYQFIGAIAPVLQTGKLQLDQLVYNVNRYATATVTMTIAAPGVVTWTAHGFTSGERVQFTTTGALPTGITASTTYWITVVDANSFKLSTTFANAQAATFITTSGSQSGTHTGVGGSITVTINAAQAAL